MKTLIIELEQEYSRVVALSLHYKSTGRLAEAKQMAHYCDGLRFAITKLRNQSK